MTTNTVLTDDEVAKALCEAGYDIPPTRYEIEISRAIEQAVLTKINSNSEGLVMDNLKDQLEDVDPLQGAADWIFQAIVDCNAADIQSRLLIGYNRAKRLLDAARSRVEGGQE